MRLPVPMGMLDLGEAYHVDALVSQSNISVSSVAKQNPGNLSSGIPGCNYVESNPISQEWPS